MVRLLIDSDSTLQNTGVVRGLKNMRKKCLKKKDPRKQPKFQANIIDSLIDS